MRKNNINTVNQTFSIPKEISRDLHAYIKRRERSHFVAEAIRKELEAKKQELAKAYHNANKDQGQKEVAEEWKDTLMDGENDW